MKIQNLKELQKLVQLCRKTGILSIKIDGIELTLGAEPRKTSPVIEEVFPEANIRVPTFNGNNATEETAISTTAEAIETEELTEDQLLMWSARPEDAEAQQ